MRSALRSRRFLLLQLVQGIARYAAWARAQRKKVYIGTKDGKKQYKDSNELRSPKTVNAYLQTLVRAYKAFRKAPENKPYRHLIPEPPEIEYLDVPTRTPTPIPHNISVDLLGKADPALHAHLRLAFILCVQTGMREKECAKVREKQYMEAERVILLEPEQTKSSAGRYVPVNDTAHKAILECRKTGNLLWQELQKDKDLAAEYAQKYGIKTRCDIPLILYRPKGKGMPRPVKHLSNSGWKTMKKNAGAGYRWHDTRAAFCTNALRQADIDTVKKLAGHQSILTTQKYLEASNPMKTAAVKNLATNYPLEVPSESPTRVPNTGKSKKRKAA